VTLFEALVALVILGLTSVGFLGAFHASSNASRKAAEWTQAVSHAEAAMEQTKLGADVPMATIDAAYKAAVAVQPWSNNATLDVVTVTVALPQGGSFVLHRLVRRP
jgi:Tfp pilus assembly protein PilV